MDRKEQQRLWVAKRRKDWFNQNGPCVDCGSWKNLELDHVNPKTKVSHRIFSWSKERREKELKKCKPRCFKCHKKKSAIDRWGIRQHGTNRMYKYGKCRCDACKLVHYQVNLKYR